MTRERRAYVCFKCNEPAPLRVFLHPTDSFRPRCKHGLLERQPNKPYVKEKRG